MPTRKMQQPFLVNSGLKMAILLTRAGRLLLCCVVLIMLFAGLRPYSSYSKYWVNYNSDEHHTDIRHFGLASGELQDALSIAIWQQSIEVSMALRLKKPPDNRFQVLAQIDSPDSLDPIIIGQWKTSIIVMSGRDYRGKEGLPRFSANLADYLGRFARVTIRLTPERGSLSVDGQLLRTGPSIPVSEPPTRISIGNSPDGTHGWNGSLRDFALRSTLEDATEVQYRFDRDTLPRIETTDNSPHGLTIPRPGRFPDRAWIGTLKLDQLLDNNLKDVIINFLGFMPFGFLVYFNLDHARRQGSRPTSFALTVLAGFLFSLAIELTQTWIPGRSPHAHDLLLNTLGGLAGAFGLQLAYLLLKIRTSGSSEAAPSSHPEPPETP